MPPSRLELTATLSAALAEAGGRLVTRATERAPTVEGSVKFAGGVVAALLAIKYAGSLKSACVIGLLSGLFAHSLYADVLVKRLQKPLLKARKSSRRRDSGASDMDRGRSDETGGQTKSMTAVE